MAEHYQKRIGASRYSNTCAWKLAALAMNLGASSSVVSGLTAVGNCSENLPSPLSFDKLRMVSFVEPFAKEG
jgi:hypothetical protein